METTLLSQLKGTAHNDNLVIYDNFEINVKGNVNWGAAIACSFDSNATVQMSVVKESTDANASFSNTEITKSRNAANSQSVIDNPAPMGFKSNGECVIRFSNASKITGIRCYINNIVPNFDWLLNLNNIKDLSIADGEKMESFAITKLCPLTQLRYFTIVYNTQKIVGKIEDLIKGMVVYGRAQESTGLTFKSGTSISYGNHNFAEAFTGVLKWENANKSYYESISDNLLYCMGYTSTEIATKTASGGVWYGKTVISVG